jgi:hypothetical protein
MESGRRSETYLDGAVELNMVAAKSAGEAHRADRVRQCLISRADS